MGRLSRTDLGLAVAVVAGVLAALIFTDPPGSGWTTRLGCSEEPLTVHRQDRYRYPFGLVRSCRLLDRRVPWFGEVDATTYLLLDTERGAVALRVDYRDHETGRRTNAMAVELDAGEVPGDLSPDEMATLEAAIKARGGLATEPWYVRYGDG